MTSDPRVGALADTDLPKPLPLIEWWRVALLFAAISAIVWWAHILVAPARAETIGCRLDIEACRESACRPILPSSYRWANQFVCQTRAETSQEIGRDLPLERLGLPRGTWTIKARCEAGGGGAPSS